MPRGVRRSREEKLRDELAEVQATIKNSKDTLKGLEEREKEIKESLEIAKLKSLKDILSEHNVSSDELAEILKQRKDNNQD